MNVTEREDASCAANLLEQLTEQLDLKTMAHAITMHYEGISHAAKATGLKLGVFRYDQNAAYLERHREAITAAADQCADEVLEQLIEIMRGDQ